MLHHPAVRAAALLEHGLVEPRRPRAGRGALREASLIALVAVLVVIVLVALGIEMGAAFPGSGGPLGG